MKVILLLLLVGCKTTTPKLVEPVTKELDLYDDSLLINRIDSLEYQIKFEWFDRTVEDCIHREQICRLEGKNKTKCWSDHEKCVIDAYHRWKEITHFD